MSLSKSYTIPTKHWKFTNYVPKNRFKDTLKPEMQREWTHLLYKWKVKHTPCGNRRPRIPLELNRATMSLICETSCPLTCPHNFILVPPSSTTFSLYSHALFNKNQALPRTRPMLALFVWILLVYYYLERSAWNMCIIYEAVIILSKLITRKYVRQQTLPSVRQPDYASNF